MWFCKIHDKDNLKRYYFMSIHVYLFDKRAVLKDFQISTKIHRRIVKFSITVLNFKITQWKLVLNSYILIYTFWYNDNDTWNT